MSSLGKVETKLEEEEEGRKEENGERRDERKKGEKRREEQEGQEAQEAQEGQKGQKGEKIASEKKKWVEKLLLVSVQFLSLSNLPLLSREPLIPSNHSHLSFPFK